MHYRWHPDQISQKNNPEQKEFAYEIRQQHQIAFINRYKSPEIPEVGVAETGHPHIGRVIGLYIMGKCIDESFKEEADKLLESILGNVDISMPLSIKRGLLGIGMGLIYLLRNNFVKGDEDEVLENIDNAIFSAISDTKDQQFDLEGALIYLRKRASMHNSKNMSAQLKIKEAIRSNTQT